MERYKLAVFDLDGTILDTTEGVLSSIKYTIQKMGYPIPDTETLSCFIGPPIQDSFARTYGLSGDILQEAAAIFRNQYKDTDLLKAIPYDGIYSVFQELSDRGITPAVATYKREDYALTLLKHFHFDQYTGIMHGGDNENRLKKQDIIKKCVSEAGISDYRKVVMIGDTIHDAEGAARLGIDFIGVTFGFGFKSKSDLNGIPSVGCADTPLQLLELI